MNTLQTHIRQLSLAICLLICADADAATVYACKDAAGGITYTDRPCGISEQTLGAKTYNDSVAAPSPSQQNDTDQSDYPQRRRQQNAVAQADQPLEEDAPEGYQCTGGGKTWVSKKPCQDTTRVYSAGRVSGMDTQGNFIHGNVNQVQNVPVEQTGLSHSDYCSQLQNHAPTSDKGKQGETDSVYERNKQRQLNGC